MKKFIQGTFLCAVMIVLFGCQDDSVNAVKGAYRYKASGTVYINNQDRSDKEQTHALMETGILELISLHDGNDLLLTFNQSGGGVYNTFGTATSRTLHIDPFTRNMTVNLETYEVEVSGKGEIYDDTIILYLSLNGKSLTSDKTLIGSNIKMLAQKN